MSDIDSLIGYLIESEEGDRQRYIRTRAQQDQGPAKRDFEREYKELFGDRSAGDAGKEYTSRRLAGKVAKRVHDTAGVYSGGADLGALKKHAGEDWQQHLVEGMQKAELDDGRELDREGVLGYLQTVGTDLSRGFQRTMDASKSSVHNLLQSDHYDEVEDRRQLLEQGRAADPTMDEDSQIQGFGDLLEKAVTKRGGWADIAQAGVSGLAQQLPALAGSALMRDPRMFLAYWTAQMQPDARQDFIDEGFSEGWANSMGWLSAFAQAGIEGMVKAEHGDIGRMGFWKATAGEFLEEFNQKAVHESMMAAAKLSSGGDYDVKRRIYEEANRELANALVVVPMLTGAGAGMNGSKRLWGNMVALEMAKRGSLRLDNATHASMLARLIEANYREHGPDQAIANIKAAIAEPSREAFSQIGITGEVVTMARPAKEQLVSDALALAFEKYQSSELQQQVNENAEAKAKEVIEERDVENIDPDAAMEAAIEGQPVVAEELPGEEAIDHAGLTGAEPTGPGVKVAPPMRGEEHIDPQAEAAAAVPDQQMMSDENLAMMLRQVPNADLVKDGLVIWEAMGKPRGTKPRKGRGKDWLVQFIVKNQAQVNKRIEESTQALDPDLQAQLAQAEAEAGVSEEESLLNKPMVDARGDTYVINKPGEFTPLDSDLLKTRSEKAKPSKSKGKKPKVEAEKKTEAPAKKTKAKGKKPPTMKALKDEARALGIKGVDKFRKETKGQLIEAIEEAKGDAQFKADMAELDAMDKEVKAEDQAFKEESEAEEAKAKPEAPAKKKSKGKKKLISAAEKAKLEAEYDAARAAEREASRAKLREESQAKLQAWSDEGGDEKAAREMGLKQVQDPKTKSMLWVVVDERGSRIILDNPKPKVLAPHEAAAQVVIDQKQLGMAQMPLKKLAVEQLAEVPKGKEQAFIDALAATTGLKGVSQHAGKAVKAAQKAAEAKQRKAKEAAEDAEWEAAPRVELTQAQKDEAEFAIWRYEKGIELFQLKREDFDLSDEGDAKAYDRLIQRNLKEWTDLAEELKVEVAESGKDSVEAVMIEEGMWDYAEVLEDLGAVLDEKAGTWSWDKPEGKAESKPAEPEAKPAKEEAAPAELDPRMLNLIDDLNMKTGRTLEEWTARLVHDNSPAHLRLILPHVEHPHARQAMQEKIDREVKPEPEAKPEPKAPTTDIGKATVVRDEIEDILENNRHLEVDEDGKPKFTIKDLDKWAAQAMELAQPLDQDTMLAANLYNYIGNIEKDLLERSKKNWINRTEETMVRVGDDPRLARFLTGQDYENIVRNRLRAKFEDADKVRDLLPDAQQEVSSVIALKAKKDGINLQTIHGYAKSVAVSTVNDIVRKAIEEKALSLQALSESGVDIADDRGEVASEAQAEVLEADVAKAESSIKPWQAKLIELAPVRDGGKAFKRGLLSAIKASGFEAEYDAAWKAWKADQEVGATKTNTAFINHLLRDKNSPIYEEVRASVSEDRAYSLGKFGDAAKGAALMNQLRKENGQAELTDEEMLDGNLRSDTIVQGLERMFGWAKNTLRLSEIWQRAEKGKKMAKGAAGFFLKQGGGIELAKRAWSNVSVALHEVAHKLDETHKIVASMPQKVKDDIRFLDYDLDAKTGRRVEEGFAEALRKYIEGDPLLKQKFGENVYPWIDNWVSNVAPASVKKSILRTKEIVENWRNMSGVKQMLSRLGTSIDPMLMTTHKERVLDAVVASAKSIKINWFDSNHPIWTFYSEMGMAPESKADERATTYEIMSANGHGAAMERVQRFLVDGVTDLNGNVISASMRKIIEGLTPEQVEMFEGYMIASHIVAESKKDHGDEGPPRYSLTPERARDNLREMERTGHNLKDFERRHKLYVAASNAMLDVGVAAGAYDPEAVQKLKDKFGDTYVSMNSLTRKGTSGLAHRKGHMFDIRSPLAVLVERASWRYAQAFRAEAVTSLALDFDPKEGGKKGADYIIRRLEKNEILSRPEEVVKVFLKRKDGTSELVRYQVNKELRAALDWVPNEAKGVLRQNLHFANKIFKLGATGASISFAVANIVRDMQTSAVQSRYQSAGDTAKQAGLTAALVVHPISSAAALFTLAGAYALRELSKSERWWMPESVRKVGQYLDGPINQAIEKMGGGIKQEIHLGEEKGLQNIRSLGDTRWTWSSFARAPKAIANGIVDMIAAGDMIPRAAEVRGWLEKENNIVVRGGEFVDKTSGKVVELTRSQLIKLKNVSENATTNFSRAGREGRNWNKYSAFVNAAIQSNLRIGETFTQDLRGMRGREVQERVAIRLALFTVASGLYALLVLGNGDEEDEEYTDTDEYTKSRYWILPNSNIRIPKSQDWAILTNSIEAMFSAYRNGDPDNAARLMLQSIENAKPPIIPAISMPAVNLYANKDDYTGRSIVPDQVMKLPTHEQFDAKTTWAAKQLSALAALPLGTGQGSKPYRPSPMGVDYFMDNMTANYWSAIGKGLARAGHDTTGIGQPDPEGLSSLGALQAMTRKPFVSREATQVPSLYRDWEENLKEITSSAKFKANPDPKIEALMARARFAKSAANVIWKERRKHAKQADRDKWMRYAVGVHKWAMGQESSRIPSPLNDDAPDEVKALLEPILATKVKSLGKEAPDANMLKEATTLKGVRFDRRRIHELLMSKATVRKGKKKGTVKPYASWSAAEKRSHGQRISRIMRRLRDIND